VDFGPKCTGEERCATIESGGEEERGRKKERGKEEEKEGREGGREGGEGEKEGRRACERDQVFVGDHAKKPS
jgi:hypothetical protein